MSSMGSSQIWALAFLHKLSIVEASIPRPAASTLCLPNVQACLQWSLPRHLMQAEIITSGTAMKRIMRGCRPFWRART